jgi:uncharacterized protein (DUF2461 family)
MQEQPGFLEELISILNQSTLAYRNYLHAGKTFQFARELKFHNSRALQLLMENKSLAEESLQHDIQSLITHYTEWTTKWEKLATEKEHQPADVFAFANDITFPAQAAQHLEDAYRSLEKYRMLNKE